MRLLECLLEQGSLDYTPEHCLVNGGSLYFGGESHVSNGQDVSFKEPCGILLRSCLTGKHPGQHFLAATSVTNPCGACHVLSQNAQRDAQSANSLLADIRIPHGTPAFYCVCKMVGTMSPASSSEKWDTNMRNVSLSRGFGTKGVCVCVE